MPANNPRVSLRDEMLALASDPLFYESFHAFMEATNELSAVLDAVRAEAADDEEAASIPHIPVIMKTDRRYGDHLGLYLTDCMARCAGNRQKAAEHLPTWWPMVKSTIERVSGIKVQAQAPTETAARLWRLSRLPRVLEGDGTSIPDALEDFIAKVGAGGVERALELGHFPKDTVRDFANPSVDNLFTADGTYITAYSEAAIVEIDGKAKKLRSRAQSLATVRQQVHNERFTKNGRQTMGVLNVVATAATPYGRCFLGMTRTAEGENAAAIRVVEPIIKVGGCGVHSVVYDKAMWGWPREYLLAAHGVNTITRDVVASAKPTEEVAEILLDVKETLRRQNRANGVTQDPTKAFIKLVAAEEVSDRYRPQLLEAKESGLAFGVGLPLGDSRYLTFSDGVDMVRSYSKHYDTLTHFVTGGECRHELFIDDGALWEVYWDGDWWVKNQRVRCSSSVPVERRDKPGLFAVHSRYHLRCSTTGEIIDIDDVLEPHDKPRRRDEKEAAARTQKAIASARLQPLARCDQGFFQVYGKRSGIESWFSWLKNRLLSGHRAASIDLNHQILDVIYGGLITNALALRAYRLSARSNPAAA